MDPKPNPNKHSSSSSSSSSSSGEDSALAKSEYLTQKEVRARRAMFARRLARCFREHYWVLMEDVRKKHREFIWKYGKSPFLQELGGHHQDFPNNHHHNNNNNHNHNHNHNHLINNNNNHGNNDNDNSSSGFSWCCFPQCPSKAMALSKYCFQHILADSNQMLYTSCQYALKSTPDGPILCGKPVLKFTVPSICQQHARVAEANVRRALKKGGASVPLSTRLAPKFHLVLTEYVRLIQTKRRAAANRRVDNIAMEDSST